MFEENSLPSLKMRNQSPYPPQPPVNHGNNYGPPNMYHQGSPHMRGGYNTPSRPMHYGNSPYAPRGVPPPPPHMGVRSWYSGGYRSPKDQNCYYNPGMYDNSSPPNNQPPRMKSNTTPPSKQEINKSKFTCETCDVTMTSSIHLQQHLLGNRHKRKLNQIELEKILKEKGFDKKETGFNCNICDVESMTEIQHFNHCLGRKHKKNARLAGIKNSIESRIANDKFILKDDLESCYEGKDVTVDSLAEKLVEIQRKYQEVTESSKYSVKVKFWPFCPNIISPEVIRTKNGEIAMCEHEHCSEIRAMHFFLEYMKYQLKYVEHAIEIKYVDKPFILNSKRKNAETVPDDVSSPKKLCTTVDA